MSQSKKEKKNVIHFLNLENIYKICGKEPVSYHSSPYFLWALTQYLEVDRCSVSIWPNERMNKFTILNITVVNNESYDKLKFQKFHMENMLLM